MARCTFTTTSTDTTPRSKKLSIRVTRTPVNWPGWLQGLVAGDQARRAVKTPLPHAARIYMDKIRMRVVAHATATQCQRRPPQSERVNSGHAQVNRFRLNVQAVLRDSGSMRAQQFIRRRGAVATNNVNLSAGMSHRRGEIGQNIVQARIEMAHLAGIMIAQEIIQLGQRARNVLLPAPEHNFQPFVRVRVVE